MMTKTDTAPPGAEVEESQSELLFQALERFIDNMETSNRTLQKSTRLAVGAAKQPG